MSILAIHFSNFARCALIVDIQYCIALRHTQTHDEGYRYVKCDVVLLKHN